MQAYAASAETSPARDPQDWARRVVRPLSRRYLLALVVVAALLAVDQAIIQPQLVGLSVFAPTINLAGRQRMLSQRITKDALAIASNTSDAELRRAQLLESLTQWNAAHQALVQLGAGARLVPPETRQAIDVLGELKSDLDAMTTAATLIANQFAPAGESPSIAPDLTPPLELILSREPRYVAGMERVVTLFEQAAQRQVFWLRGFGLAALAGAIALLLVIYRWVLRPADRLIRRQFQELAVSDARHRALSTMLRESRDELERRVAERTSELSTANITLRREVAERQAAEQRTQLLSAQLAHAARVNAMSQLATGLAHEINQPLASITNYAETLDLLLASERPLGEHGRRAIDEVRSAALRAGAIVRRMRQFIRPGASEMTLVEVNQLTQSVCELCSAELRRASVACTIELAGEPAWIHADGLQIQQVLVNLIQNAVQAMSGADSATRRVWIGVRTNDGMVRFEVADSGPGFASGLLEDAFTPFFTTKPDGLGIGLAISRSIVQRHRGDIWVDNRPGGGGVVGFSLPLDHSHDVDRDALATCVCG